MFELSKHPILFQQAADLDITVPGWIPHIPFSFLLVDLLRPRKIVELGVHSGNSYLAFCQAVQSLGLNTHCFGVDSWKGDPQAGYYGESVYKQLSQLQEEKYGHFSSLLRMQFEKAVSHFEDGSIDLLHIDGLHTYEAVKEDFETWLPKMSRTGVVLIHDTQVRKDDFGVWRFWEEISAQYPSFNFEFSNGLGVLLVGQSCPESLTDFINKAVEDTAYSALFYHLGQLVLQRRLNKRSPSDQLEQAQLFYDTGAGWMEENSLTQTIFPGDNQLQFYLPDGQIKQLLRFDPAGGPCAFFLRDIRLNKRSLDLSACPAETVDFRMEQFFVFTGEDPQLTIKIPEQVGKVRELELDIQYLTFDLASIRSMVGLGRQISAQISALNGQIAAKEQLLSEQRTTFADLERRQEELQRKSEMFAIEQRSLTEKQNQEIAALRERNAYLGEQLSFRNELLLRNRDKTIALSKSFQGLVRKKEEVLEALTQEIRQERLQFQEWRFQLEEQRQGLEKELAGRSHRIEALEAVKKNLEDQGAERERAIHALHHQLSDDRKVLAAYAEDNVKVRASVDELRSSLSFKIGWFITWPVRIIYNLFFGGKMGRSLRVLAGLVGLAIKSPLALLRHFRLAKIGVLFRALRHEPPQQILNNFRKFLRNGSNKTPNEVALPIPKPVVPIPVADADFEGPLISVVIPVYNTPEDLLTDCIRSVLDQYYTHWELIIIDDCSTKAHVRKTLDDLNLDKGKVRVIYADQNLNIAEVTNRGIEATTGDFIALLDHDDLLTPDALLEVARYIDQNPDTDVLYSDQDKIDERGNRYEPFFKPDWSPWFFRGVMYVGHLLVFRKILWEKAGKFDSTFDGIQDYEFILRLSEHTDRIAHLPKILYHWRAVAGSIAADENSKGEIADLQARAVNDHLERSGIPGKAVPGIIPHRLRIIPGEREHFPKVSIIIPTRDAPQLIGQCLESIFTQTTYPNFEVLLVDNQTSDPEALRIYDQYPVRIIPYNEPFNFSRANNLGVEQANGEYLLFLNNDVELLTPSWLEEFLFYVEQERVGAVGPMLTFPNGGVQHAGVVLGFRGTADHVMRNFPHNADGYFGSLSCGREVSALTAACMMMSKELFEEIGGFNEVYAQIYQDVDLCLKIREKGLHLIYDPNVRLIHYESATRDASKYDFLDRVLLLDQWQETIDQGDPFYNPNFNIAVYSETESGYHF